MNLYDTIKKDNLKTSSLQITFLTQLEGEVTDFNIKDLTQMTHGITKESG